MKLIPELRFPEFEDYGEWKKNVLGSVADFLKGKGISKSDITPDGVQPCVRYGELYTHYNEIIDSITSKTNLPPDQLVLSKRNDVIIPSSGETQEDIATASCVLEDNVALGGDINIIRTKIQGVFLAYYLSNAKKREIAKLAQGNAVVHLYISQLEKLEIEIPKLDEQQKIASCLSSLDALIAAHNDKLDALNDHKKGMLQNLFPQEGETVPKVRFPEFEGDGEWVEKKLGQIGEPLMCKRIFKDQTTPNPENGIPFYKIGTFGKEADAYIPEDLYIEFKNKYNYPNKGDILISASGTIGRLVIYDGSPAYYQDSNIVWLGHDESQVTNEFLFYCYSMVNWQTSDGGVIKRLYNSDLKNVSICYPENDLEQQKIASGLSAVDELITAQQEKIEELQQHKKGLMQGLFPKIES